VALVQADACSVPFVSESFDAVVSANLLEHVADDGAALGEIYRLLKRGGRAVLVVPRGPGTYDYYDRYLHHERRYARHELAEKARTAGFEVLLDVHLGSLLFPPFWAVKKYHRLRFADLQGLSLERRVLEDIASTKDSRVGHVLCRAEERLLDASIRFPVGIRGLTVARKPEIGTT
jgi:SAM-dependent methyltransferase